MVFLQLIVKVGEVVHIRQLSLRFNRGMKTRPETAKMGLSGVLLRAQTMADHTAVGIRSRHELFESRSMDDR